MNKQDKLTQARQAARETFLGESHKAQAIAILAGLASGGKLAKYVRDEYRDGLIDERSAAEPAPDKVEAVDGESDAQYNKRLEKAQKVHAKRIASWARVRVSRASTALRNDFGVEVPNDSRGGSKNAGSKTSEASEDQQAEANEAQANESSEPAKLKGADEHGVPDTSRKNLQRAADTLAAAIAAKDGNSDAREAFEKVAAFLKLKA